MARGEGKPASLCSGSAYALTKASPVNRQVIARGMKFELPHAAAGQVTLVASPMKFSGTPLKHDMPPPVVGQHTDEILRTVLKKTDAEIAALKACGAV